MLAVLLNIPQSKANSILRLNYGILFEKQANVHFSNDVWMHTFQIRLPVKKGMKLISPCKGKDFCENFNKLANELNILQLQTTRELNQTITTLKNIIPTKSKNNNRKKKAILGFIGELSKSIFGTATVSDVKLLAQHINALTTRTVKLTKEMAIHSDHQSSFMSIINKRISNIVNEMKDTHDEIDLLQNVIRNNTKALEKLFFTISNTI